MVAVKIEGTITPTITQESLFEDLKRIFFAAGYATIYAEFDENDDKHLVYQIVNDATKTFGTVYLQISVTYSLEVKQKIHTSFDSDYNEGSNTNYYDLSSSFSEEHTIRWIALNNGSEFKTVLLYQRSFWSCLGFFRPPIPPSWNENESPYVLVSSVREPLDYFYLSEINPYLTSSDPDSPNESIRSNLKTPSIPRQRNPFTNDVDVVAGLLLSPQSGRGLFGMISSLGFATDTTLGIGDSIVMGDGATYCVIGTPSSSDALPKLVVRIA